MYLKVIKFINTNFDIPLNIGARGGAVVEALLYKPKDHGIDSRWCH
jgi:hypothetical protein